MWDEYMHSTPALPGTSHEGSTDPRSMISFDDNFVSLIHLVDESLFHTDNENEVATSGSSAEQPAKRLKLDVEASVHAFIADIKNKSEISKDKIKENANKRKEKIVEKESYRSHSCGCRSPSSRISRSPSHHKSYRRRKYILRSPSFERTHREKVESRSSCARSRSPNKSTHCYKPDRLSLIKFFKEDIKSEASRQKKSELNSYYCSVCQLTLSSEITWQTHRNGKKHAKNLRPHAVHEVTRRTLPIASTSSMSEDMPRFGSQCDDQRSSSYARASGLSWRSGDLIKTERRRGHHPEFPLNNECLDTSKADFYCKLCDCHMNNIEMWEAHVKGKRHLKNAKKIPGEPISSKSVRAPNVSSQLEKLIDDEASEDVIVGLEFVKETQGKNGVLYNCFLCGAVCTNYDILDHLVLAKHRNKYLEKLDADGKKNEINSIKKLEIKGEGFRKSLIAEQCRKMLEKYGRGHVEVYVLKI